VILLLLAAVFGVYHVSAEDFQYATATSFKVSPLFGDNMIFQQNEPIKIWGTSSCEGEIINARFGDSLGWGVVTDGKWEITLSARTYSAEPEVLEIYGSGEKSYVSFENIRIGDIWWVVGQSNVEYTVSASPTADQFADSLTSDDELYVCTLDMDSFSGNDVHWKKADKYSTYTSSALGSFLGKKLNDAMNSEVPIAVISMGYSGRALSEFMPKELQNGASSDGIIYKNVIGNIVQMPIKGMVWYQGESDAGTYSTYASKLSSFIKWLRQKKNMDSYDFPVYAVELPPCFNDENDSERSYEDYGCVRGEIGSLTCSVENFHICPTSDLWSDKSYSNNIHPNNKDLIADRLSLMILSQEYGFGGQDDIFGPEVIKAEQIADGQVILKFRYVGDSLSYKDFSGFTIIGANWDVIENAHIEACGNDGILISADEKIYKIRYATKTENVFGKDISLSSSNGVPAASFCVTIEDIPSSVSRAVPILRFTILLTAILILFAAAIALKEIIFKDK
jgi:sialate O-acetylesterase